jgi:glutamate--cysteine ligase
MGSPTDSASPTIRGYDDLLSLFSSAEKPASQFRIGAEAEKFGVDKQTGAPIHYEDESGRSVRVILESLVDRHGWTPEPESPGGPLIALRRGQASVTLEPGAQLELSGAPLEDVHAICSEARGHLAELRDISAELGVTWLGVGFHPFARQEDLDWVPKARYKIMRVYLPSRGKYSLDMMRRTATVQANYDFSSEEDAMQKTRVSLKLAPLTTAMFANSPFYEGKLWGGRSYRAKVWLDVDNDRAGLVPNAWKEGSRYRDYIEWALDVPMFLVKRGGEVFENTGQSFRSFLTHGFRGQRATMIDWETHCNTVFPEVRLKRTIEVRGADSLPADLACALPALWTGIFYDDKALAQADDLSRDYTYEEVLALRQEIPEKALGARFRGKPLADVAQKLLEIAKGGLERRARLSRDGKDERVHLARLEALVAKGHCPADVLLLGLDEGAGDFTAEMLRRAKIS